MICPSSLLYWSSLEPTGKIEVSNLNGTARRVVVNDTKTPTGIAVSHGGELGTPEENNVIKQFFG